MWLDVLDMPTVNHFETSFADHFDKKMQKYNHEDGDSLERYASGVLPDGMPAITNRTPVINYPYAEMRPILERMKKTGDIDKRHGARVRYTNPINGGPVLPTMGAYLALLPKGFKGEAYRSTDGTVFACAEGKGYTVIDGEDFEWGVNDVFVVPPWKRYQHNAGGRVGAVLDLRSPGAGSARHLARRELSPVTAVTIRARPARRGRATPRGPMTATALASFGRCPARRDCAPDDARCQRLAHAFLTHRSIFRLVVLTAAQRSPMQLEQLSAGHGALTAVRTGKGRDLVVLHSLLADRHAFDPVLPALAEKHRVTLINLPGFHGSEPTLLALMDAYVAAHRGRLREFDIGNDAILIGNGFGGTVALAFALAHPERIAKLVLSDAAACFPPEGRKQFAAMAEKVAAGGLGAIAEIAAKRVFSPAIWRRIRKRSRSAKTVLLGIDPKAFQAACKILQKAD